MPGSQHTSPYNIEKAQPILTPKVDYEIAEHKNEAVIFIRFDYDAALIARVKKLVGVQWSQSKKAWYVRDTEQYRQKFGLTPKPIGANTLPKIDPANQAAFTAYIEMLQLKAYSKSTINTYRNEFSQLLFTLKSHKVEDLTPDRLRSYFLYCVNELKLSENTLHSRTESYKDDKDQTHAQPEWHSFILWRGLAELAEKYLKKGSTIHLEGKNRTRSYEDKQGQKRYVTEVVGEEIILLDKKED